MLAAAIYGGAGLIVTFNLRDFPASVLGGYSVEAVHPDDFITGLWNESPDAVLDAVRRQRASLRNPPRTAGELLNTLEQCGLAATVALLPARKDEL